MFPHFYIWKRILINQRKYPENRFVKALHSSPKNLFVNSKVQCTRINQSWFDQLLERFDSKPVSN